MYPRHAASKQGKFLRLHLLMNIGREVSWNLFVIIYQLQW